MSVDEESQEIRKRVDEAWKAQVEKERASAPPEAASTDFTLFLSSLSMQALVALGELAHPTTNSRTLDLEQARYLIDMLGMLEAKTKGNLEPQEAQALKETLYELRMKYVAKAKP